MGIGLNKELIKSVSTGNFHTTEFLIDSGADVNWQDEEGRTPLMWAIIKDYKKLTEYLKSKGARI
jgi:ankyrin repeat protein